MTGSSSRLRALERGLKGPRKPRAKARALTVMRLEGATTGAKPTPTAHGIVRLPAEIAEQIEVVRGRSAGKPSRGLKQLEERLLRSHDVMPTAPMIQRHEHAAPTPAPVTPATTTTQTPKAQAHALAAPIASGAFGGRFNVESFEDTSAGVSRPNADSPRAEIQPGASLVSPPRPAVPAPRTEPSSCAVPWAAEQSQRAARKRALSADQKAVAESFERDIAAMLGGDAPPPNAAPEDKQWEDTLRNAAAPPATAAPAVVAPSLPAPAKPDAHDVFNQMGLAMNYANRFDLGAVDLSARFDQFENELALAPSASPAAPKSVPVKALELDYFDLMADLSELSSARSEAAPASTALTTEPMANTEQAIAPAT